jgi:hypothetical protein
MTNYRLIYLARPVLLIWFIIELYVAIVLKDIILFGLLGMPIALFGWYTRCRKCGNGVCFDKSNYYNMFLLKPNKVCTVCGSNNDEVRS